MFDYSTHVKPFSSNFALMKIENVDIKRIDDFIKRIRSEKKNEDHHKIDDRSFYQRFFTGTLGELALEKFLGIEGIVDWTVGDSVDYSRSDLKRIGLDVGVKTVRYGSFPIIFKKNFKDQIIMIRWKSNYVYICGLAKRNVLNKYQSDELINDNKLRERGIKTGFHGFEHLIQFKNLDELKSISKQVYTL
jgi:hypothetical protein